MSLHALYVDEGEYLTLEQIIERIEDEGEPGTQSAVAAYIEARGLEPADCNLCGRSLPADATLPLCSRCQGVCQAHARLEQASREWVADGRPD